MNFDRDRSGTMEGHELQQAITSFGKVMVSIFESCLMLQCTGYNLSPQAIGCLMRRYSTDGKVSFDDFVSCVTKLRSITSEWCR